MLSRHAQLPTKKCTMTSAKGQFDRVESSFRHWITPDGEPGPSGKGGFAAESGRYHLYVSLACPWAHRAIIMRERKGLQDHVGMSVVHWRLTNEGWRFEEGIGVVPDSVLGKTSLSEIYKAADAGYRGRFTVPLLWDRKLATIVSNESSEIIRMFDLAFEAVAPGSSIHYPEPLRAEIDAVNDRVYSGLNDGVYKAGFARTQQAYDDAFRLVAETLEWLETRLATQRYLVGRTITESDIRLFTTLVRFDAVYYSHFKCNHRRIAEFPALSAYLRDLYQSEGFGSTVDFGHIKRHYYESQLSLNPSMIVPLGPVLDFEAPHHREKLA